MAEDLSEHAIHRSVDVDAEPADVWNVVVDDSERAAWFGGPTELTPTEGSDATFTEADGTRRNATVDAVIPERHLAWTWRDGQNNECGRVTIDLTPAVSGTRIDVIETPPTTRTAHFIAQNSVLGPHAAAERALCGSRTGIDGGFELLELEHMLLLRTASPVVSKAPLPVCVA